MTILFTTTIFLGIVIILRLLCNGHISARLQYALWLFAAVKLLVFPMPVLEGELSVLKFFPGIEEVTPGALEAPADGTDYGTEPEYLPMEEEAVLPEETAAEADGTFGERAGGTSSFMGMMEIGPENPAQQIKGYLRRIDGRLGMPLWVAIVSVTGSIILGVYMLLYHISLGHYLKSSRKVLDIRGKYASKRLPVYSVEGLPTPCLFGGSIYVPERLAEDKENLPHILQHEACHAAHGDAFWGFVRLLCVCLYWYHPLVWAAACLSRQDCELACDEAVIKKMKAEERKKYGELLLEFALVKSTPRDYLSVSTTMSGNARNLKKRLEGITGKKKKRLWLGLIMSGAVLLSGFLCITDGTAQAEGREQSAQAGEEQESSGQMQEENGQTDIAQEQSIEEEEPQQKAIIALVESAKQAGSVADLSTEQAFQELMLSSAARSDDTVYLLGETESYSLYGSGDFQTMVLEKNGKYAEIQKEFFSHALRQPPELAEADYDGDQETELAIKLNYRSEGYAWFDILYMADEGADGEPEIREYESGEYISELFSHISMEDREDGSVLLLDGAPAGPVLKKIPGVREYDGISLDNADLYFTFSGGRIEVQANVICQASEGRGEEDDYTGTYLTAEVLYDGGFSLTDIRARNRYLEAAGEKAAKEVYAPGEIGIVSYDYDITLMPEGELSMILTVLEDGNDSYDYAEMIMRQAEDEDGAAGDWYAEDVVIEK